MNTSDSQNPTHHRDADEAWRPSLARRMRLVSRLLRAEMHRTLHAEPAPTRGEVKAAARALEERVTGAVSAEELATTLATLDKIAEALGGRDALPYRGHRGHGGRGGPRGLGRGGAGRGFAGGAFRGAAFESHLRARRPF